MTNLTNLLTQEETEIWLPIPGVSNIYRVSNQGRIKSIDRQVYRKICCGNITIKGKIIRQSYSGDKYLQVTLYGGKVYKAQYRSNQLVFFTFNPEVKLINGYQVDHIDNNKENNRLSNLQYIKSRHNSAKRSMNLKKTSQFTGVSWSKERNKWQSHIRINGKSKSLGRYSNEIDASIAYQKALQSL